MQFQDCALSQGQVEFIAFPAWAIEPLKAAKTDEDFQQLIEKFALKKHRKNNLVFNFPREQYAKLDRGETPDIVYPRYITFSNTPYTNPSVEVVTGEIGRVETSTNAIDSTNAKNTIIRFVLDVGQLVGNWSTAILIGGPDATATPGTGKIIAAVNNIKDDTNAPVSRDGTTVHLINWKIKHLDSSEV